MAARPVDTSVDAERRPRRGCGAAAAVPKKKTVEEGTVGRGERKVRGDRTAGRIWRYHNQGRRNSPCVGALRRREVEAVAVLATADAPYMRNRTPRLHHGGHVLR
jgi:hypothetical protein